MTRVARTTVLALVIGLLVAACGDDDGSATNTTNTTAGSTATSASTTDDGPDVTDAPDESEPPDVSDLSGASVSLTRIAELDQPIALAVRPGSPLLFVAEREGRVRTVQTDGRIVGEPVVDITDETTTNAERGLLSLTFHPDGDRIYLSFTDPDGHTQLDEWMMDGDLVDPDSRRTVYRIDQPFPNHNGGHIAFGPDGYLYLGLGDGGGAADPLQAGQDPDTALGSIIRIDPTPTADAEYRIPDDNPFASGGGAPEIWLIGVRNPWRFAWDHSTGNLWIADVGQNIQEEVTVLTAPDDGTTPGRGRNLGWSLFEGNHTFVPGAAEPPAYAPPVHTYNHGQGCSITGGYVSRGDGLPGLRGVYVYSDFCDPNLYGILQVDGEYVEAAPLNVNVPGGQVASFGEGPDGELYVLSLSGGVYRLDPA